MIAIGCDHGALELKEQLIEHLKKRGVECKDSLRNRDWNEHGR